MLQDNVRQFVGKFEISKFYDIGRGGICHQVMAEKGHVLPGEVIVGADSHSCTYGALGAFSTGVGSTDAAAVLATGTCWLRVPEDMKIHITGRFKPYVFAKDLLLKIASIIGAEGGNYKALEYTGPTIREMSVDSRLTMCNMAIELGAKNGIIEPDHTTEEYVKARAVEPYTPVFGDPDAHYEETLEINVDDLEPQVACPHSVDNVKPISEVEGTPIDEAFLGSCTNARIEDLRIAANILKGKRVADAVRMIVVPSSMDVYKEAEREGLLRIFLEAGAFFSGSTCGACMGRHLGVPGDGEVVISSIPRNFRGRMGNPKSEVYLGSPAVVAASAITGTITNPKGYIN